MHHRYVNGGLGLLVERHFANVAHDADDLLKFALGSPVKPNTLPQGVLTRKDCLCERFVDNDHVRRLVGIELSEIAAFLERNAENAEVVFVGHSLVRGGLATGWIAPAFDGNSAVGIVVV